MLKSFFEIVRFLFEIFFKIWIDNDDTDQGDNVS